MTAKPFSTVVIGVGNTYRGDDGVGIIVVRRLKKRVPTSVKIIEESGEGAALLDAWDGATMAILVDAARSGAPPGTTHRLDGRVAPIPSRFFHHSTHAFGVAEAVELARALHKLPLRLVVYGIEGKNVLAGVELSVEVEQAIEAVVAQVLDDIGARTPGPRRKPISCQCRTAGGSAGISKKRFN